MILVTGATGSVGSEVLRLLVARHVSVRAMVRDVKKAETARLPGVEIVQGDFDRPETLRDALDGVESAFLLTNSTERAEVQQTAFVEAARASGLAHLVKLSQLHADANSQVRFLRYHAVVEDTIKAAGLTYTFLRPNLFMQGLLNFAPTIKEKGAFFAAAGNAKVSMIDVRDIAAVAVAALTEGRHDNKTYNLTGPQALSHAQAAQMLGQAVGRTITFTDVPPEAMKQAVLQLGMPLWQADGLLEDYAHYRRGEAEAIASGVQDATGNAPRSFDDFARDFASSFS